MFKTVRHSMYVDLNIYCVFLNTSFVNISTYIKSIYERNNNIFNQKQIIDFRTKWTYSEGYSEEIKLSPPIFR